MPDIFGTKEGIAALGEFIENSGAFTRSGEVRSPRLAPEMEEEEEREWWEEEDESDEPG